MTDSYKGHFLIAAKHLRDGNFFKSVVLMIEHNENGAMGLVVNRPLDVTVREALLPHFRLPKTPHPLFDGGPVEENALLILHNSPEYDQELDAIVPGVFVGTSPDILDKLKSSLTGDDDTGFRFRIFAGYSGWGEGQLEGEMSRGDWLTFPASSELVFAEDPYNVWETVLSDFQKQHRIFPHSVDRPELN
jgi:putative transcriptional regulator